MKRCFVILAASSLLLLSSCGGQKKVSDAPRVKDTPYPAPYAVKYTIPEKWQGAEMYKLAIDGDDNVYALTNRGLYRDFPGNLLGKDLMYTSLSDKTPADITVQQQTGYLYYLYPDRYLTNRASGAVCGHLPKEYRLISVASGGDVLLAGVEDCALYRDGTKVSDIPLPGVRIDRLYSYGDKFFCLAEGRIHVLSGSKWERISTQEGITALAFKEDGIVAGTGAGFLELGYNGSVRTPLTAKVPIPSITDVDMASGKLWFASTDGVYMQDEGGFKYFGRQRWVNENEVIDIAPDSSGNIYMLTRSGLGKIEFRRETMASKAEYLLTNLRKYHLRFGFSEEYSLLDPDDPTSIVLQDSDNDGLWSSFYLGAEAFRYAVTKDPGARENAWETFGTFERLISIHEPQWFSSRSFERAGFHTYDKHGAWRQAPDPDWDWKGTTSTDEFVGYLFITAVMDEFVAETKEEKDRVARYISTIMDHIIENNLYFIDVDGEPTLWGRLNPDYVNSFAHTQFDRILNSVLTFAGFQEAYALTGKEKYKEQIERAVNEFGYLDNIKSGIYNIKYTTGFRHKGITLGEDWNHSDDEMAFLTYWALCRYALDDTLKEAFCKLVEDHWEIERPEGDALWNLIAYHICGKIDLDKTLAYLREFPIDCTRYEVKNSQRSDLDFIPYDVHTNFRAQLTKELLPKNERPVQRHNRNEFYLDSSDSGRSQLAGDEYLLPYWMARYLEVIE